MERNISIPHSSFRNRFVGRVTDPSGAALPGASVTAVEDGTQQTYSGKTNEECLYSFPFVRVGTYTITATAPGFGTMMCKDVVVQVNQVVRINLDLAVGQASEKVTVSAAPAPIATDEASISEVLSQKAVGDLPLNGRDVLRAAALTPGFSPASRAERGSTRPIARISSARVRARCKNSISLDGVSITS